MGLSPNHAVILGLCFEVGYLPYTHVLLWKGFFQHPSGNHCRIIYINLGRSQNTQLSLSLPSGFSLAFASTV